MTVSTTGAPLMNAENCNAVIKHSLSNTDVYCKIHLKAARYYKMILLFRILDDIRTRIREVNDSIYFDRVSEMGGS